MTVTEYKETLDLELEMGLLSLEQYNLEVARLKFAEEVLKG